MHRFAQTTFKIVILSLGLVCLTTFGLRAQEPPGEGVGYTNTPMLPGQSWRVHDKERPRPPIVKPGEAYGQPPADAIVLFDGKDLSKWKREGRDEDARWAVRDGYMEVVRNAGSIVTREEFGDVQLHIEFATPEQVSGSSQGRGNSGVMLMGKYEFQVLDSFQNDSYADGQVGAIYGQYPPQVNVARGPGQWQTYDIIFEAPHFQGEKVVKPARVTIIQNGVVVQNARELIGQVAHQEVAVYRPHPPKGPILLQDHGNPTRFRNIWVRPLREEIMPWLSFPGLSDSRMKSSGKKVVLISGDEEYRSEEAMPMLAQILSEKHGFTCTVLFSINPDTQTVDPNYTHNIPGMHLLDDADVVILGTRFRELPDWQMKHFVDFVNRGGSLIGLRTSTHAFAYSKDSKSPYAKWSYDSKDWEGGFGQQILGDTWVSHHGRHRFEATRAVVQESAKSNPILRGVEDIFVPSDVYGVAHLPPSADVLLKGQVIAGMNPTDLPLEGAKNNPMMPIAWTRAVASSSGKEARVFCTTMGASIDLANESLRRLIVNATYWAAEIEAAIPAKADVSIRGEYKPTFYGFHTEPKNYFKDQLLKPEGFIVK